MPSCSTLSLRAFQNSHLRWRERIERILYVLLFLLLPIERVAVLQVGGFTVRPVYFVMFALLFLYSSNILLLRIRADVLLFALSMGVILLVSAGFSVKPGMALLYTLWALFTVLFSTLAVSRLRYKTALVEFLVQWYMRSAVLWSIGTAVQWFLAIRYPSIAYSFLGGFPRVHALTLEPSYLATYLIFPFFLTLAYGLGNYALPIGAALILSTSRTGLLALALGLVVFFFVRLLFSKIRQRTRIGIRLITAAVVTLLFLGLSMQHTRTFIATVTDFLSSGLSLEDTSSAIPRLKSWKDAYQVFMYWPWTGVGTGAYGYGFKELGLPAFIDVDERTLKTTNLYLEVAAESGIPGLILLMFWVTLPIWNLKRCPLSSRGFAVLLAFIALSFTFPFIQTWWRPYLWVPWIISVGYVCRS